MIRRSTAAARRAGSPGLPGLIVAATCLVALFALLGGALALRAYAERRDDALQTASVDATAGAARLDQILAGRLDVLKALSASTAAQSGNGAQLNTLIARVDPASVGFSGGMGWVDRDGVVAASSTTDTATTRVDVSDRDYVKHVLATGQPYVDAAILSRQRLRPLLVLALPTRSADGTLNGVLVGSLLLDAPVLDDPGTRLGPDIAVLDRANQVIFSAAPVAALRAAGNPSAIAALRGRRTGRADGTSPLTGDGGRVIAFATVPTGDLLVIVDRSRSTVLAGARRSVLLELGIVAVAALLALLTALWGVARVARAQRAAVGRSVALQEATAAVAEAPAPVDVALAVTAHAAQALGGAGAALLATGPDGHLRMLGGTGLLLGAAAAPLADPAAAGLAVAAGWDAEVAVPLALPSDVRYAALPAPSGNGSGVLAVAWRGPLPSESDRRLVETIGLLAGQALDRAGLYAAERETALGLQRSMLPSLHDRPGLELAARYLAGVATLQVGGDWYDAIATPDGWTTLVVGDVAGRGVEAAAAMVQIRSAVRALAISGLRGAALLSAVDEVVATMPEVDLATMVLVHIDPSTGLATYARAGHPPALMLDADGARLVSSGRSAPIGVADAVRGEAMIVIPAGGRLVLYTDGLVERRGERIDDGLERLGRSARALGAVDLDQLADGLLAALLPTGGGEDDVCLLCCRVAGDRNAFLRTVPSQPESVTAIREQVRGWLAASGVGEPAANDLLLALGETVANAVEHGRGDVTVVVRQVDAAVEAIVRDSGTWLEANALVAAPGERGRGLDVVRRVCDEVEIDTGGGGTHVVLRRALDAADV